MSSIRQTFDAAHLFCSILRLPHSQLSLQYFARHKPTRVFLAVAPSLQAESLGLLVAIFLLLFTRRILATAPSSCASPCVEHLAALSSPPGLRCSLKAARRTDETRASSRLAANLLRATSATAAAVAAAADCWLPSFSPCVNGYKRRRADGCSRDDRLVARIAFWRKNGERVQKSRGHDGSFGR